MFEKLYKWMKSGSALMLALLLMVHCFGFAVPMIATGLLCKLGGLMVSGTLVLYALRNLGLLGMGCCRKPHSKT